MKYIIKNENMQKYVLYCGVFGTEGACSTKKG